MPLVKAPEHDLNLEDVPQYFETHKIEATMAHLVELLLDKRPTNPRLFILQCAPGVFVNAFRINTVTQLLALATLL